MLVRPLSTVDNTRDYTRVSHSRQWSNYNIHRQQLGCIHIDTSTGYGYPSAGYSKHKFARIPMAAFTLIKVHYEFDFH